MSNRVAVTGYPGLNRQERKVHLIGPLAIEDGPCREHDALNTGVVQGAREILPNCAL